MIALRNHEPPSWCRVLRELIEKRLLDQQCGRGICFTFCSHTPLPIRNAHVTEAEALEEPTASQCYQILDGIFDALLWNSQYGGVGLGWVVCTGLGT
ncbi:conserved hypothetical protein [Ricinus communis]|uniref:Uncharacterized protein n=1 Tax=Ricinus communis TaxID=3988 RepID=B9RI50_RICCO|nr:conserved hypothetical protein [Ricinus communis]